MTYISEDLKGIKISLPSSIEAQKSIVQQLEQELANVDKFVVVLQKEIGLLHELKNRLISDVVTGQIDVRNIEVPDYDFVDETEMQTPIQKTRMNTTMNRRIDDGR